VHQFGKMRSHIPLGFSTLKRHTVIMAPKHPKRPRDPNQLGKLIVDLSVGETIETPRPSSPATEFARSGGLKGGYARAASLTAERRREIGRLAAEKRWGSRKGK
jgi:hypothetical protein